MAHEHAANEFNAPTGRDTVWAQTWDRRFGKKVLAKLAGATDSIWTKDNETKMEDKP